MIDFFASLVLFESMFWGITMFLIFILFCVIADYNENGFLATWSLFISMVLFYYYGKDTFDTLISFVSVKNVLIYFGVGLIHAIVRVFFYGRKQQKVINEYESQKEDERTYSTKPTIDKSYIKNNVFRWWFLFPVSMVMWFLKDMIKEIYFVCYERLSSVFNYVFELGIKSAK